jgi:YD repeat-containing protein
MQYDYDAANLPTAGKATADRATGRIITTTASYDPQGWLSEAADGNGRVTRYVRDANGNPEQVYSAFGTPEQQLVSYEYDANNNVVKRTDTGKIAYATSYEYNANNLLFRTTAPKPDTKTNSVTTHGYDANGNLNSLLDPNGRTTTYDHDQRDRLKTIQYPATGATAAFSVGYTYNAVDARETMTDPTGTTRYSYDELGRLRSVVGSTGTVGYGYDVADPRCQFGKASTLTYPLVATPVSYCHDQAGRILQVADWEGRATGYAYDAAGRLRTMTPPNDTRATYDYDDANRLRGVRHERLVAIAATTPGTATTAATPTAPLQSACRARRGDVRRPPRRRARPAGMGRSVACPCRTTRRRSCASKRRPIRAP